MGAYSKVQKEFFYLESGTTPLKQVITSRRLMYLQTVLKRSQTELVRQVYKAQKSNPVKGDWVEQVRDDLELIDMVGKETEIEAMSKMQFKTYVRNKIKYHTLRILDEKKRKTFKTKSYTV